MKATTHKSQKFGLRFITLVIALNAITASTSACNIPVFRYALERWQPDYCDIVVFHQKPLAPEDAAAVTRLGLLSKSKGGVANFRLVLHAIDLDAKSDLDLLWQTMSAKTELSTPYVVVRSRIAKGKLVNSGRGSLSDFRPEQVLNSPARTELGRRLLTGSSTVWLVLKSSDEQRNVKLRSLLESKLKQLSNDIPLPEGIGLPGSELLSEVPLLMKFSILEIDPADAKESHLVSLLSGLAPDVVKANQPLVVPVFGRGRALEVIPGDQVKESLVEDLTVFLSGACSCQVKEMNPGFDLLMSTDWKTELFGEDGMEPVDTKAKTQESDGLPVLVPIPSGRRKPTDK